MTNLVPIFPVKTMKLLSTALIGLLAFPGCSFAQTLKKWKAERYVAANGTELPYRLLSPPDLQEGVGYPLVIFLHGAGERGHDNELQLKHVAEKFEAIQADYPSFVLFPQVAEEQWWSSGEYRRGDVSVNMEYQVSDFLAATMTVTDILLDELPVDPHRVYIGGLSMGGFGTWDAIARWPEKFAAAFPICGAGDPSRASQMLDLPVWVLHGADDNVVPTEASRVMVEALREAGGQVIYTEFPGVGHNSWDPAFASRLLMDWLFTQQRR